MTKLTKKDLFKMVAEIINDSNVTNKEELSKFIYREIELIENKSANRKPTQNQLENEKLMETICEVLMKQDTPVTITELQAKDTRLSTTLHSNQKISALMKKLVDMGKVSRIEDKRKSYFKIAE